MKILTFNAHTECAISHCLLYGKRLGFEIYFANREFGEMFNIPPDIFAGTCDAEVINRASYGELANVAIEDIGIERFMDMDFDYVLLTIPHLIPIGEWIKQNKPSITLLAYSGNVGFHFPEHYNFISSGSFDYVCHVGPKLLIHLELLPCFFRYEHLQPKYQNVVRSFPNFVSATDFYNPLLEFEQLVPEYKLLLNGLGGRDGSYTGQCYKKASQMYKNMVAAFHLKRIEGYGLSLAHIAASGRQIFADFIGYGGQTLWPILHTWGIHVDGYNATDMACQFMTHISGDDERMQRQAKWVRDFFNYDADEERVRRFLSNECV